MMIPQLDTDVQALVRLNAWGAFSAHPLVLLPQTCDVPIFVVSDASARGPYVGRLFFFKGFPAYRDFVIFKKSPDTSLALSLFELEHVEFQGRSDVGFNLLAVHPGFAPREIPVADYSFWAPIIHECLGMLIRIEDDPDLLQHYVTTEKFFSRQEGLDGKWRDAPYALPQEKAHVSEERIALNQAQCQQAVKLPFREGITWELDFFSLPFCQTNEENSRILYLLAAVDSVTGERILWDHLFVSHDPQEALLQMWTSFPNRLLRVMLERGCIPGAVNVRSGRVARFLRPLGLQIPFRLVQSSKLQALDGVVRKALEEKKL